jgi:drug/metabolite transporter (DMT)-like permease
MLWIPLALLTALFESLKDVVLKHNVRGVPAHVLSWSWAFFALPFLGVALLLSEPVVLGEQFWLALLAGASLNIGALSLYVRALGASDLSTTVPLIAFSPLFLLVTSPLIVGEFPDAWGVVGVLLVVVGSYLLNIRERQHGYLAPFRALLRERGPRLMLGVALLWSIAATVDKVGVQNSSPTFWVAAVNLCIALGLTPLMLRTPGGVQAIGANWRMLLLIGFFAALAVSLQMVAISMTLVAYVISIKRVSILLSVLWGALLFHETGLRERLAGTLLMLLGVIAVTLP